MASFSDEFFKTGTTQSPLLRHFASEITRNRRMRSSVLKIHLYDAIHINYSFVSSSKLASTFSFVMKLKRVAFCML